MIRRRYNDRCARKKPSLLRKKERQSPLLAGRRCLIETLELRQLLSANAPQLNPQTVLTAPMLAAPTTQHTAQAAAANGSLMAQTPLPLTETFQLHSDAGETNVIYLDFDGFVARNTTWNAQSGLPNILTGAFDVDGDPTTFSDAERTTIQSIWERISEDFRPFEVDVTTEDPGDAAIAASGIRVVIGGSKRNAVVEARQRCRGGSGHGRESRRGF